MCCETWPRTMPPSPQLKAHYGAGPWVLVSQSECCWASTSSRRGCRPLFMEACLPTGNKGHKVSWLSVSIGLCLSVCLSCWGHTGRLIHPDLFFTMKTITNIMTDDVSQICESQTYTLMIMVIILLLMSPFFLTSFKNILTSDWPHIVPYWKV